MESGHKFWNTKLNRIEKCFITKSGRIIYKNENKKNNKMINFNKK